MSDLDDGFDVETRVMELEVKKLGQMQTMASNKLRLRKMIADKKRMEETNESLEKEIKSTEKEIADLKTGKPTPEEKE